MPQFLQPQEAGFLHHLKEARVPITEFDFPSNKIVNIQSQLEKLVSQNYYLNVSPSEPFSCNLANTWDAEIGKGRVQSVYSCLLEPQLAQHFRRQQARSRQGCQELWLQRTATYRYSARCQHGQGQGPGSQSLRKPTPTRPKRRRSTRRPGRGPWRIWPSGQLVIS